MKLVIEYDPVIGESVPDGKIYAWLKDKIVLAETLESPLTVTTSTSLVIEEARALIIEKALSNKDVMFKFRRKELRVDKYGNLENWPGGFCDAFENILERLIFKKQSKKE